MAETPEFSEDDMWDDLTYLVDADAVNYGFLVEPISKTITVEQYGDNGDIVNTKKFKLVEVVEDNNG